MTPPQPPAASSPRDVRVSTPAVDVDVANRQQHLQVNSARLRQIVRHVLEAETVPRACVSLAVVDDQTIQELHRRFLNDDTPTDVLSFPLGDKPSLLEGEVVVNAQRAIQVAARLGCPAEHELLLYVVHGTLHLCGYDDRNPSDAATMRNRQVALLAHWGIRPADDPQRPPSVTGPAPGSSGEE